MTTAQQPINLRELDAWIAEHVMGWKRCKSIHSLDYANRYAIDTTGAIYRHNPKRRDTRMSLFHPSTDPAAAMEVLKKCIAKCNEDGASLDLDLNEQSKTLINKMHYGVSYESSLDEEGETLELAICLFAKKLFTK